VSMWNKGKEDEPSPRPANVTPRPVEPTKEGIPLSTTPLRNPEPDSSSRGSSATIGKSVSIKGQIFSREDLIVEGDVEGSIELNEHRLTIGPNGKVKAEVKAREIVVLGTIQGNVEAGDKIDIRKDAKLVGDIKTARIVIEDGAYFKGSIDIVRAESVKPNSVPRPQVSAPSASPLPVNAYPSNAPVEVKR